jgi:hypothetical protein
MRQLSRGERAVAASIFQKTLPYNRIFISSTLGLGNRPFTTTVPPLSIRASGYLLNVGRWEGVGMDTQRHGRALLAHELTHVWQGHHSWNNSWFMISSALHQGACGIASLGSRIQFSAYSYTPGGRWDSYNVEQQAEIVEHWYSGGMRTDSALYSYIRDHIRAS